MCDCENRIIKNLIDNGNYHGRKIMRAISPRKSRTLPFELQVMELKNTVRTFVEYYYCPFCGQRMTEVING